ncbi:hypothetical protein D3C72_2005670 [compost metagenome]
MPAMAAHSPATGGTPIMAEYARPTGSATAATLRPAVTSRRADSRVMPRKLFRPGRKRRFMVQRDDGKKHPRKARDDRQAYTKPVARSA